MEEKEVIEKRTVRREDPLGKTTNVQQSGDEVVEEEHIVEEHRHP